MIRELNICPKCKRNMNPPFIEKDGTHSESMCKYYLKVDRDKRNKNVRR